MTSEGAATARTLLDRMEAAIAARDTAALDALCVEDTVLFGTSAANFGGEESRAYVRLVAESNAVRWLLDRWAVVHEDDGHLLATATGVVEGDDGNEIERSDFRLSLWLVRQGEQWRIGHFHGSVPQA
ncbi:nuclear transport factor 2 family protein [Nocardioides sp. cx-169]|uniref:nuclear transport factor 2 family protein n=1 Tax=Nocardioides sp. cx-169 TaxID=2899080 RepID=UPI001E487C30|nr:nuclear transport factor 2 family protein [Nocardioides sp. cx-169]MCD4535852.1 nuclear transport factor 2 family protein [Nocardioides sp. cx-169]